MKLLFLTTLNSSIEKEHVFTRNVWEGLCHKFDCEDHELVVASIFSESHIVNSEILETKYQGRAYYQLHIPTTLSEADTIGEIARLFRRIAPSVIHSNMVESYDVAAAKQCSIPIIPVSYTHLTLPTILLV